VDKGNAGLESSSGIDPLPEQILPVWDETALQSIVGDNVETLARLLDKYLLSAGKTIASIHEAVAMARLSDAADLAHKLKSSSRAVGAMRLGSLCEKLEQATRVPSGETCQQLAELIVQGFAEFQARTIAR
jgi:HPt (histidine-containing phosphotransfer) domain-containing protein